MSNKRSSSSKPTKFALPPPLQRRPDGFKQVYLYDPRTDQLVGDVPSALGRAKYDRFTVLLVIGFTVSDLDQRAEPVATE